METSCPSCQKRYKVPDEMAGKRAQCKNPECATVFVVQPAAAPPPSQAGPPPVARLADQPATGSQDPFTSPLPSGPSSPMDDLLASELSDSSQLAPAPVMPAPAPRRRRGKGNWQKPAILGGLGVLAVAAVVGLVFLLMSIGGGGRSALAKGGPLDWGGWAVTADAEGVVYFDVGKLLNSELFRLIKEVAGGTGGLSGMSGAQLPFDPLELADSFKDALIVIHNSGQRGVGVVRTREDLDLSGIDAMIQDVRKKVGAAEEAAFETRTFEGVEYLVIHDAFVAKTEAYTFCVTMSEPDLHAALTRRKNGEPPALSPKLRRALESTRGDHFIAATNIAQGGRSSLPGRPPMGANPLSPFG
ncbi:MAG: zinc ribbon domain-containing protein, partial [Planctomycetota bacterium]